MPSQEVNKLLNEAQWESWEIAKNMHDQCKYLFNNSELDTIIEAIEYNIKNQVGDNRWQKRNKKILATALLMRKVDESYK